MKLVSYDEYEIISGEDVDLSLPEIFELIDQFSWNKRSFITFPINDSNLFQLGYDSENKFIVEITNDTPDMIFHQKYANIVEAQELLEYYFNNSEVSNDKLSGFYEVPICSKTLDEVIKDSK